MSEDKLYLLLIAKAQLECIPSLKKIWDDNIFNSEAKFCNMKLDTLISYRNWCYDPKIITFIQNKVKMKTQSAKSCIRFL